MPAKLAPPPPVTPETWRTLLAAAADFAALEPWEFACDSDPVGLFDPTTGETRIGHVLGNAGEVFAAVFYRRAGLRWILAMLGDSPDPEDLNHVDGMDCLKVEFVPKRELAKEDLAVLKAAAFKPAGKARSGRSFGPPNPAGFRGTSTRPKPINFLPTCRASPHFVNYSSNTPIFTIIVT
jgi:hypothetical protein